MSKHKNIFPYVVVLKQRYRFLIGITGMISGLIFLLTLMIRIFEQESTRIINISLLIVATGLFIQQFSRFRKRKKTSFRYLFTLAAVSLLIIPPFQPLCILFAVLAILEKPATTAEEIGFSEDLIMMNGIFKRKIYWEELSNVILKDGIITIDFKNNKLIQKDTDDDEEDEEYDVSEYEFNQYCKKILSSRSQSMQE